MDGPRRIQFDFARHRRVLNFAQNYVRLNEFPEWFTVDENHLYRLRGAGPEQVRLGSELIAGVVLAPATGLSNRQEIRRTRGDTLRHQPVDPQAIL